MSEIGDFKFLVGLYVGRSWQVIAYDKPFQCTESRDLFNFEVPLCPAMLEIVIEIL